MQPTDLHALLEARTLCQRLEDGARELLLRVVGCDERDLLFRHFGGREVGHDLRWQSDVDIDTVTVAG